MAPTVVVSVLPASPSMAVTPIARRPRFVNLIKKLDAINYDNDTVPEAISGLLVLLGLIAASLVLPPLAPCSSRDNTYADVKQAVNTGIDSHASGPICTTLVDTSITLVDTSITLVDTSA
jgi:hypothetical protein